MPVAFAFCQVNFLGGHKTLPEMLIKCPGHNGLNRSRTFVEGGGECTGIVEGGCGGYGTVLALAVAVKWRSSDFNHNLRAALKGFRIVKREFS